MISTGKMKKAPREGNSTPHSSSAREKISTSDITGKGFGSSVQTAIARSLNQSPRVQSLMQLGKSLNNSRAGVSQNKSIQVEDAIPLQLSLDESLVPLGLWDPVNPEPGQLELSELIFAIRSYNEADNAQSNARSSSSLKLATVQALEHLAAIQGLITTIAALDPITAGFPRFVTLAARTDNEIRRQKSIERISEAVTDYYDIQRAFATEEDVKRKRALINQSLAVLSTVQRSLFPLAGPFTESEELPWLLRPMILWLQNEHKARVDDFNKLYTSEEAPEWEDIGVEVEHGEQPLNWYWDKLSTGEGLIKIVGPDGEVSQEVEFPSEIRAMFMRLLAVPIGRRLLRSILENARNHEVVIRELRPLEYGAGPAVALGREPHLGRTPGVGSAVEVAIASGFSDLELLNEDELQRHILIPAFLVLGHELVHALHIVEGREAGEFTEDEIEYREWRKKRGGGGYTTGSETLESVWTAAEEEKTIAIPDEEAREIYFTNEAVRKEADKRYLNLPPESQSAAAEQEILQEVIRELIPTENTLRLQLGLPLRHGHGGKWLRSIPPGARKPELTVKRSQYEQLS